MADEKGFTLLEMLVALTVLGLVVAGLFQGTRFGLQAWQRQTDAISERDQLDAVDRTLRRLLTTMKYPRDAGPDEIGFTSELPLSAASPSRLADMTLLVDDQHRLVLRWTPRPHEARLGGPDAPTDTVILTKIDGLELNYWRDAEGGKQPGWRTDWTGSDPPPLIKLTLVFPSGDHRRWPAIIVAPALTTGR